jgi:DNA polymerase-1
MKYEIIGNSAKDPRIAILVPRIQTTEVDKYYYQPHLKALGENVMIVDLYFDSKKKKTPVAEIKEYLDDLLPILKTQGIEFLVVTNPDYHKVLTKGGKTDASIGDFCISKYDTDFTVTYCPNYARMFYDPDNMRKKIGMALESTKRWAKNDVTIVGSNIIKFADYPTKPEDIDKWLVKLLDMDCDLTCDIEGFGLKHYDAGIGTITFCWNQHEGIAFPVDYTIAKGSASADLHGVQFTNTKVRTLLLDFFHLFKNKMIYHNICYDVYVLIYQLFMEDLLDQKGLLEGLEVMLKNWECTQIISYLATNSCAGNELGLKAQAQEFAGNYAVEEINDIKRIPQDKLLEYNLIDGLSTWYVYNKNLPIMMADDQMVPYHQLFRPAVVDIIQMQLTGMPINMEKVIDLNDQLDKESEQNLNSMNSLSIVWSFVDTLKDEKVIEKNAKLKTKQITKADLGLTKDTVVKFNPGSPQQLQRFLYDEDMLGLPVLDYTDTKQPATGAETLEKLTKHTKDPEILRFLEILIEFKASAIILSTFLPAFLKAQLGPDGWHYLFGNFRLGGTASGRLSSNGPNLQNIPSAGSTPVKQRLAKLIKECFQAPPGWQFVGLDFDSLEDKISAVTTNDPEKIKVYSDGYDGHCLRALAYFREHMPDIEVAPDGAATYMAMLGDKKIYFHSDEEIEYLGQKLLGSELFALLNQGA